MIKRNTDLRIFAKVHGVPLWQVADRLGLRDSELSRKMRYELSEKEKEEFKDAVNAIVRESST